MEELILECMSYSFFNFKFVFSIQVCHAFNFALYLGC
jgi:hypothetical protein